MERCEAPDAGRREGCREDRLSNLHPCLVGYVTTANGEELAFSIICNDATGQSRAGRTIDAIVTLLAQQGPQK